MAQTITIDSAGRVVIPKDIRSRLHLRGGSRLQVRIDGDNVVLEPEEVSDGVVEDEGLLLATGRLEWPDHRVLRADRLERLGKML